MLLLLRRFHEIAPQGCSSSLLELPPSFALLPVFCFLALWHFYREMADILSKFRSHSFANNQVELGIYYIL
jgi:hypothetical protein